MKNLLLLALIVAQLGAQAASKPKKLVLITEQITMGISESDFVALLSETVNLTAKNEADFTQLCSYEYNRQMLKDVVRYDAATQRYLAPSALTKMYVIENPTALWPQRQRVVFYFYRENSGQPFTLFAIHAVHKVEVGDMNTLFEKRLPGAMANRAGKTPLILSTTYHLSSKEKVAASMAVWKMDSTREILFVPNNGPLIFTEFIFVDDLGFKNWTAATAAHKASMKVK
jgi:hypothetical protein